MEEKTITEIIDGIKSASSKGFTFINGEIDKLLKAMTSDLQKLVEIANDYQKKIETSKVEWKRVKEEVEGLESNREPLKEREAEVEEKIKKVNEDEENLLILHKVLENRRKILDARTVKIKEKERRLS